MTALAGRTLFERIGAQLLFQVADRYEARSGWN